MKREWYLLYVNNSKNVDFLNTFLIHKEILQRENERIEYLPD